MWARTLTGRAGSVKRSGPGKLNHGAYLRSEQSRRFFYLTTPCGKPRNLVIHPLTELPVSHDSAHLPEILARKLCIGTCAWSFEDWRGVFYPASLPANQRLEFYARYLNSVEIDSTFYAVPGPQTIAHWLDVTPADFIFSAKMPREITHDRKLRECEELLHGFLEGMSPLRSRLACVLIQLPPYFTLKNDEFALRRFIAQLPSDFRFAIEFRDPSWHLPRIAHVLESHHVCWAWNDLTAPVDSLEGAFEFLPRTADFLYVRLMGDAKTKFGRDGNRIHRYQRLLWPRDASLDTWVERVAQQLDSVSRALIYSNNHFEGFSPQTSRRLAERFGLDVSAPSSEELAGRTPSDQHQQQLELL
ncbi:MAG: hypothetical protein JWL59_1416 [Chthoniobacteraceae bacterium]|nr:hypothetical protein [Chthoniobacteraceae bacterium]